MSIEIQIKVKVVNARKFKGMASLSSAGSKLN